MKYNITNGLSFFVNIWPIHSYGWGNFSKSIPWGPQNQNLWDPPLPTKTGVKYYWILLSKQFPSYNGKLVYSFFKTPKHSFPNLYTGFYPSKTVLGTKIGAHGAGFDFYHELIT